MLSDGATLRQAAHQAHVSLQTALLWKRKMQRIPDNAGNTVLSGEVWVDHTYINAPMSVRKGKKRRGTGWHRGFKGCFSRTYSPRLLRLSRHGALRQLLPRVHGEDGELGGSGCPLSPQSGQPAGFPGQAHVCRAPADPPKERSLMAERESVPEGKDGEHGVRQIPVVLLQKNLLVRENPRKTGYFCPLATLLFILLFL